MSIALKRVYDAAAEDDGVRVLVDRVWPRGVSREQAKLDLWLKEVAPSTGLRKWFGHDPDHWDEFRQHYFAELEQQPEAIERLLELARQGRLTLVYSARDTCHNQAVALHEYLRVRGACGQPVGSPA